MRQSPLPSVLSVREASPPNRRCCETRRYHSVAHMYTEILIFWQAPNSTQPTIDPRWAALPEPAPGEFLGRLIDFTPATCFFSGTNARPTTLGYKETVLESAHTTCSRGNYRVVERNCGAFIRLTEGACPRGQTLSADGFSFFREGVPFHRKVGREKTLHTEETRRG